MEDINRYIGVTSEQIAYNDLCEIEESNLLRSIMNGRKIINIINTGELNKDILKHLSDELYFNINKYNNK
jgi:hypothetical protein